MAIQRLDHVGVVVDDLEAAVAFFVELGMDLDGETTVEGRWVDRVAGLDDVRADIAMMRTPDGHGGLELTRYRRPAAIGAEPASERARSRSKSSYLTDRGSAPTVRPPGNGGNIGETDRGQARCLPCPRPNPQRGDRRSLRRFFEHCHVTARLRP